MRVSVLLPTYNSAPIIRMTLDSVLCQTRRAEEVLIWDDGSTDETHSLLAEYGSNVVVFKSVNRGVARARNELVQRACGDVMAFLDHDDIWHPEYLSTQTTILSRYPTAVASYTGHINLRGLGKPDWPTDVSLAPEPQIFAPLEFLSAYNKMTGRFGSMSFCCVRRAALDRFLCEPFHPELSGVDDSYLASLFPLLGDVVFSPRKLVCYRLLSTAQSVNRLKMVELWIKMFELLSNEYAQQSNIRLRLGFRRYYAAKRRQFGRMLMGTGAVFEARRQFWRSAVSCTSALNWAKSLALLTSTYLPRSLQPVWPPAERE